MARALLAVLLVLLTTSCLADDANVEHVDKCPKEPPCDPPEVACFKNPCYPNPCKPTERCIPSYCKAKPCKAICCPKAPPPPPPCQYKPRKVVSGNCGCNDDGLYKTKPDCTKACNRYQRCHEVRVWHKQSGKYCPKTCWVRNNPANPPCACPKPCWQS